MPEPTRSPEEQHAADQRLDTLLGNLLRFGVLLSGAVVFGGGIYYLFQHGREPVPNYGNFEGQPRYFESVAGIFAHALAGRSQGVIMVGIILLIGTPIARVVFSVFAFAVERDYLYVIVTLIVLAILLYS